MHATTKRGRRAAPVATLLVALALGTAPAAIANSDATMRSVIATETGQAVAELRRQAAELRLAGVAPRAGELTARALPCANQVPQQPFLAYGDTADYTPLPGGAFEGGTSGWALENEAELVPSVSPLSGGRYALALPKGSKAESAPVCITAFHPTIRFFARALGSAGSRLRVEVLYEDLTGSVKTQTIAWLRPTRTWAATEIVPIAANVRADVDPSGTTAVAFRFSVEGGDGTWFLDDIWVDPFKSR